MISKTDPLPMQQMLAVVFETIRLHFGMTHEEAATVLDRATDRAVQVIADHRLTVT